MAGWSWNLILIPFAGLLAYWILARSCGHDHKAIAAYGGYLMLGIWLPGHCLLVLATGHRVGWAYSVALGLPLGFACEILLYLACAMAGFREAYAMVLACGVLGLAGGLVLKGGWRGVLPVAPAAGGRTILGLSFVAFLAMATMAARIYAPAPLDAGRLLHSTHHDWVYLISRAAELKHHWPLEDPSMAGTPLSYHYFLMAHVAAATRVTGLEIPLVLLRLVYVPMAAALLMQAFMLGNLLARSRWGGLLAAVLLFATGEVSWPESNSGGLFQSLFVSWLYVSPTFFFGMIFMGAMMVWMHRIMGAGGSPAHFGVLFLLALVGTGAKGTTAGPLAAATALWCLWQFIGRRRWSGRMLLAGALLTAGFCTSYVVFLRGYSGEGTVLQPFAFPQVSRFWLEHVGGWQARAEQLGLPRGVASGLVGTAGMLVVLGGLNGVLLAGFIHVFRGRTRAADGFAVWTGLVAVSCVLFGNALFLDSHGESYLYLPMKLPLAALAAAAAVVCWRDRVARAGLEPRTERKILRAVTGGICLLLLLALIASGVLSWWWGWLAVGGLALFLAPPTRTGPAMPGGTGTGRFLWGLAPLLPLGLVLVVQLRFFLMGNRSGFTLWQASAATARESSMSELQEALDWMRRNTPTDALIVATTFSPEFSALDRAQVVDRTTADKHYYYSALAERRLFVEGPAYVRDQQEAAVRMQAIRGVLRGEALVLPAKLRGRSLYMLVDRAATAKVPVVPPTAEVAFANNRIRLYRIRAGWPAAAWSERLGE